MNMAIKEFPNRKHPRMKHFDYSSNGNYFVTICTHNHKQILSYIVDDRVVLTNFGEIVKNELINLEDKYDFLKIENYVIMPNHVHVLFLFQHDENKESAGAEQPALQNRVSIDAKNDKSNILQNNHLLQDIVGRFKSISTKTINKKYQYGKVFQTSFYEHVITDERDWSNIWDYIDNNPRTWNTDELY